VRTYTWYLVLRYLVLRYLVLRYLVLRYLVLQHQYCFAKPVLGPRGARTRGLAMALQIAVIARSGATKQSPWRIDDESHPFEADR
jgi:hypothetical protein